MVRLDPQALWPLCLDLARGRDTPSDWNDATGHTLDPARWNGDALSLFELMKPLLDARARGAAWAIGQLGQSLDGCIATHTGDSCFVNCPEGLVHVHRLRALCDAVIVGAGTASLDNPQLTTRRVEGPNATRVVLDPSLRVPVEARVFNDAAAPTLLVCAEDRRAEAERRVGAQRVVAVPGRSGRMLDLRAVRAALEARGLKILFVEGGGITVSEFVRQDCLDRLHLLVAPVVIGDGQRGLAVRRSNVMGDALRPPSRTFPIGGDVLWDLDLQGR